MAGGGKGAGGAAGGAGDRPPLQPGARDVLALSHHPVAEGQAARPALLLAHLEGLRVLRRSCTAPQSPFGVEEHLVVVAVHERVEVGVQPDPRTAVDQLLAAKVLEPALGRLDTVQAAVAAVGWGTAADLLPPMAVKSPFTCTGPSKRAAIAGGGTGSVQPGARARGEVPADAAVGAPARRRCRWRRRDARPAVGGARSPCCWGRSRRARSRSREWRRAPGWMPRSPARRHCRSSRPASYAVVGLADDCRRRSRC